MKKYILPAVSVLVCVLFSVIRFINDHESNLTDLRIIETFGNSIEAGVVWGVFMGLCFSPGVHFANRVVREKLKLVLLFLVFLLQAFIGYFVNPVIFHLSQIA